MNIRWFLFQTPTAIYGVGTENMIVTFLGKDCKEEWMGVDLKSLKPYILEHKIKVKELT